MSKPTRICSIDGCGRIRHARGWCQMHYRRWQNKNNPPCAIDGCDTPMLARGWCIAHYERWRAHGDPLGGGPIVYATPEEAFAARTERQGDCLIWIGGKLPDGYGQISVGGRRVRVHRYAWEREHGPIPEGVEVDHICHSRACVNVKHLRIVTRAQNMANQSGAHRDNKSSGVRNVHRHGNGWRVSIGKDGKPRGFGTYPTIEEAAEVAEQARKELFGEYAGRG